MALGFSNRKETKQINMEECVELGGHCFVGTGVRLMTSPPQHPEKCKHCPATRIGTPRSNMHYRYPEGQP